MSHPTVQATAVPWVTVDQMREADRLAIEVFGIGLLQMMEHAGRSLAELTADRCPTGDVVVLAGGGSNGGGGLCAARHLANRGRNVAVVLASDDPGPAATHQLRALAAMGISPMQELPAAPIVIDALVGYGLRAALRGPAARLATKTADRTIVSLDFPSGHGAPGAVMPDVTLTLALPKEPLRVVHPLFVADLGLPDALWARMGIATDAVFAQGPILEIVSAVAGHDVGEALGEA